ncbi:MAG: dihydrolipoamide acetyltransferase family protein [Myxococcales bacterium]|nr:2-oxo acid dehydrogenase subunit E2 [Polyangiaceae bacterium]MDW8252029.1 dihydrolipoamide acetyltransferase family protein [Myxococcales bacterium]
MASEKVVDVVLPSIGESIVEASIKQWFVKQGDVIRADQIIVSISSEKTDVDLPANVAGRIVEILAKEGDTLAIGSPIARVEPGVFEATPPTPAAPASAAPTTAPLASPAVRQLAREHGVDLSTITGSGDRGRITQADVLSQSASAAPKAPPPAPTSAPPSPAPVPTSPGAPMTFSLSGGFGSFKVPPYIQKPGDQIIPFSRKRRITADHMVYSKLTSPHVVTVAEVDLHAVMKHREANKAQYKKEGVSLTVLAYVCQAAVKALRAYPGVNARVLDGATALLKDVNLGVAVDAPDGLVVPNIKNADELSLKGIARAIGDLAQRARENKLLPDDFSGATFTVTNPGPRGNLFGGAIISQPNVAILRMGEIKKRVVIIEENGEDRIAIHPVMYLALSYDHRVIDGVLGNDFLWTIADLLRKGQFEA